MIGVKAAQDALNRIDKEYELAVAKKNEAEAVFVATHKERDTACQMLAELKNKVGVEYNEALDALDDNRLCIPCLNSWHRTPLNPNDFELKVYYQNSVYGPSALNVIEEINTYGYCIHATDGVASYPLSDCIILEKNVEFHPGGNIPTTIPDLPQHIKDGYGYEYRGLGWDNGGQSTHYISFGECWETDISTTYVPGGHPNTHYVEVFPKPKKMTVAEIAAALGHDVEIIKD